MPARRWALNWSAALLPGLVLAAALATGAAASTDGSERTPVLDMTVVQDR
ncbi:MAG TPA: hypothetical protein VNA30_02645 [Mycobacteriales bacterium]|nr:hypothetical protein [Mycobacteriales bacterium]